MLNLYRRHLKKCPHRAKGTGHTKCSCPVWCDGELRGRRVRESLKTRDWQRAIRRAAEMEDPKAPRVKPIVDSISAFENHILSLESSTQRKYKNVLSHFGDHCKGAGLDDLLQVDVEPGRISCGPQAIAYHLAEGTPDLEAVLRILFGTPVDRAQSGEEDQGTTEHQARGGRSLHIGGDRKNPRRMR